MISGNISGKWNSTPTNSVSVRSESYGRANDATYLHHSEVSRHVHGEQNAWWGFGLGPPRQLLQSVSPTADGLFCARKLTSKCVCFNIPLKPSRIHALKSNVKIVETSSPAKVLCCLAHVGSKLICYCQSASCFGDWLPLPLEMGITYWWCWEKPGSRPGLSSSACALVASSLSSGWFGWSVRRGEEVLDRGCCPWSVVWSGYRLKTCTISLPKLKGMLVVESGSEFRALSPSKVNFRAWFWQHRVNNTKVSEIQAQK